MGKVTVRDIYPRNAKTQGDVGIEVEVEAAGQLPTIDTTWWKTTNDPSLRGGMEYINKAPMPVDDRKLARITKLTSQLESPLIRVNKDSHRTSIHVHNNVNDFTPVQVWTGVTAYWLLENLLFQWIGREREGLLFCLRLCDAEFILKYVKEDLATDVPFQMVNTDNIRYASINLAAIARYGSLELRGMRGTIDPVLIDNWSTTTFKLFQNARHFFATPEELLDFFYHKGRLAVLNMLLPTGPILDFCKKVANGDALMEENACRMADFVYSTPWTDMDKKMEKLFSKNIGNIKKKNVPDDFNFVEHEVQPQVAWPAWAGGVPLDVPVEPQLRRPRAQRVNVNPAPIPGGRIDWDF